MTITSSPPIRTSPTVTTVSSGLNVRLASLYGSEMRTTSCTPSSISIEPGVGLPLPDGAEDGARHAGRAVHVHAHLDQPRDDVLDLRLGRPFFHHDNHGCLACLQCCVIPTAPTAHSAVAGACSPCTTRRSSRRASSMMRSNSRAIASAPSGPSAADVAHVLQHVLLAVGLVDLDALLLLQPADLADAARALVQQPDEHFVHAIDVASQIVKSVMRHLMRGRCTARFSQRTYAFDAFDKSRRVRAPRQSATPARCRRRRRRRSAPTSAHVLGPRDAEARARSAASCARGSAAPAPRRPSATAIARAGHAEPRDAVQEPAPELRRLPNPRVGRRRAQQEDRIEPGRGQRLAEVAGLLDRQIERQHAVHAGRRRARARTSRRPCAAIGFA